MNLFKVTASLAMILALASCSRTINGLKGPTFGKKISNVVLADTNIAEQSIANLPDRNFRTRYWTIKPGGVVPIHEHSNRPATIYVLQGEIYEYRDDQKEPVLHKAGSLSLEAGNLAHWWVNRSNETVLLVAADVYKK